MGGNRRTKRNKDNSQKVISGVELKQICHGCGTPLKDHEYLMKNPGVPMSDAVCPFCYSTNIEEFITYLY